LRHASRIFFISPARRLRRRAERFARLLRAALFAASCCRRQLLPFSPDGILRFDTLDSQKEMSRYAFMPPRPPILRHAYFSRRFRV